MKKSLVALAVIVPIAFFSLVLINVKGSNSPDPLDITPPPTVNANSITAVDTSMWERVQLHQNISVLIPNLWSGGSDGIYNYDYTKVTGIRDPNFPDNSFKCVFYIDESLRSKIIIESEKILNTQPKITYITAKWNNDNGDSLRKVGDLVNVYTFNNTSDEKYIECTVFKGVMLEDDKNKLENSILTLE